MGGESWRWRGTDAGSGSSTGTGAGDGCGPKKVGVLESDESSEEMASLLLAIARSDEQAQNRVVGGKDQVDATTHNLVLGKSAALLPPNSPTGRQRVKRVKPDVYLMSTNATTLLQRNRRPQYIQFNVCDAPPMSECLVRPSRTPEVV